MISSTEPQPPATYLGVARSMYHGVDIMAQHKNADLASALALVAAHTLECTLKAFLSRDGNDLQLTTRNLRHHIEELWNLAKSEGLPIDDIPQWASNLSDIHKSPYHLRYSPKNQGIVLPGPEPMATELKALIELVGQEIDNYRRSLE